jgi:uncharacterized protein (TIGR02186 family)
MAPRLHRLRLALVVLVAALVATLMVPREAHADALVVDLSKRRIEITSGFAGTDILLFGAIEGRGDMLVVVRGPIGRAVLRHKARVAGIWVNRDQWTFDNVPYFYRLATSGRLQETVPNEVIEKYQIGEERLRFVPVGPVTVSELAGARKALLRKLNDAQHYDSQVGDVEFIGPGLFSVRLHFPASIHVGTYQVEAYLLRFGEVVSRQVLPLEIEKTGVGAQVYRFAQEYPAAYGAIAVAVALLAGWLASLIFRKR